MCILETYYTHFRVICSALGKKFLFNRSQFSMNFFLPCVWFFFSKAENAWNICVAASMKAFLSTQTYNTQVLFWYESKANVASPWIVCSRWLWILWGPSWQEPQQQPSPSVTRNMVYICNIIFFLRSPHHGCIASCCDRSSPFSTKEHCVKLVSLARLLVSRSLLGIPLYYKYVLTIHKLHRKDGAMLILQVIKCLW